MKSLGMKTLRLAAALALVCGLALGAQAQDEQDTGILAPYVHWLKDATSDLTKALQAAILPACADLDSDNLRINGDGAVSDGALYCREIAHDGEYRINPGAIGNQGVIARGVRQAYDVFGLTVEGVAVDRFDQAITVCLRGRGDLIFLPAFASPRPAQTPQSYSGGGYTCARLGSPGIVALVAG